VRNVALLTFLQQQYDIFFAFNWFVCNSFEFLWITLWRAITIGHWTWCCGRFEFQPPCPGTSIWPGVSSALHIKLFCGLKKWHLGQVPVAWIVKILHKNTLMVAFWRFIIFGRMSIICLRFLSYLCAHKLRVWCTFT